MCYSKLEKLIAKLSRFVFRIYHFVCVFSSIFFSIFPRFFKKTKKKKIKNPKKEKKKRKKIWQKCVISFSFFSKKTEEKWRKISFRKKEKNCDAKNSISWKEKEKGENGKDFERQIKKKEICLSKLSFVSFCCFSNNIFSFWFFLNNIFPFGFFFVKISRKKFVLENFHFCKTFCFFLRIFFFLKIVLRRKTKTGKKTQWMEKNVVCRRIWKGVECSIKMQKRVEGKRRGGKWRRGKRQKKTVTICCFSGISKMTESFSKRNFAKICEKC